MTLHDLFDVLGDGSTISLAQDMPNGDTHNIYNGTVGDLPYRLMRDYGSCDVSLIYDYVDDTRPGGWPVAYIRVLINRDEEDDQ